MRMNDTDNDSLPAPHSEAVITMQIAIGKGATGKPERSTLYMEANQRVPIYFQGEDNGGFVKRENYVLIVTKKGLALAKAN